MKVVHVAPGSQKAPSASRLITISKNKGTQEVRVRYDMALPPIVSIAGSRVVQSYRFLNTFEASNLRCIHLAGFSGNVILANSELTAIDGPQVTK